MFLVQISVLRMLILTAVFLALPPPKKNQGVTYRYYVIVCSNLENHYLIFAKRMP